MYFLRKLERATFRVLGWCVLFGVAGAAVLMVLGVVYAQIAAEKAGTWVKGCVPVSWTGAAVDIRLAELAKATQKSTAEADALEKQADGLASRIATDTAVMAFLREHATASADPEVWIGDKVFPREQIVAEIGVLDVRVAHNLEEQKTKVAQAKKLRAESLKAEALTAKIRAEKTILDVLKHQPQTKSGVLAKAESNAIAALQEYSARLNARKPRADYESLPAAQVAAEQIARQALAQKEKVEVTP
jgi:hypothetical protein